MQHTFNKSDFFSEVSVLDRHTTVPPPPLPLLKILAVLYLLLVLLKRTLPFWFLLNYMWNIKEKSLCLFLKSCHEEGSRTEIIDCNISMRKKNVYWNCTLEFLKTKISSTTPLGLIGAYSGFYWYCTILFWLKYLAYDNNNTFSW